jgi:hypothetical protein
MADDDQRPLIDPQLFAPSEFIGEDMDHNVDVTGNTNIEVEHDIDLDVSVRRIELGVVLFAVLVVCLGTLTPVGPTVQVSGSLGTVLVVDLLFRALGQ